MSESEFNPFEIYDYNDTHPELQDGEVFFCNTNKDWDDTFNHLKYKTKRKGEIAYNPDGTKNELKVPIFVQQQEYNEARDALLNRPKTNFKVEQISFEGDATPLDVEHDLGIRAGNLNDALDEVRVENLAKAISGKQQQTAFKITWEGTKRVPHDVMVGGKTMRHTQNGFVYDSKNEVIGTYSRIKDCVGENQENEMIIYLNVPVRNDNYN